MAKKFPAGNRRKHSMYATQTAKTHGGTHHNQSTKAFSCTAGNQGTVVKTDVMQGITVRTKRSSNK